MGQYKTHESHSINQQYVIFTLVRETMGISIQCVKEVVDLNSHALSRIPGSPSYFIGVINLRGLVVPLVDARKRFNFGLSEPAAENPKAIILQNQKDIFGLVVDDVEEVVSIDESLIEETPANLSISGKDRRIGRISGKNSHGKENRFVFLLSKDSIFEDYSDYLNLNMTKSRPSGQKVTI
jgi:purine-binding chemotaxis protein CheW